MDKIELAKNNYDGNVCVHFKDTMFLKDNPGIDYYKDADCVIIGGHFPYKYNDVENNVDSFEEYFINHFNHEIFKEENNVYQMMSTMSYDDYIEERWIEVWDLSQLNRTHEPDFNLQANAYEGFFRAIQKEQPGIKGIFHYGFWWDDVNFEDEPLNVGLKDSIRNKDAEHIYYRWSQVLK